MSFRRYGIYYLPPPGPLAAFGASWLGWDIRRGCKVPQPAPTLAPLTQAASRYGFHATLKAPFALAEGVTLAMLQAKLRDLAQQLAPITLDEGLKLAGGAHYLALVPVQQPPELVDLASRLVRRLDQFRAPLSPEDRARRRPENLTEKQRSRLDRWGYPWIFDEFHFHLTLTGPVSDQAMVRNLLDTLLPDISQPHPVASIALVGEAWDGYFHMIEELELSPATD